MSSPPVQYTTMNGFFKVCGFPTASRTEVDAWADLDAGTNTAATFLTKSG